MASVILNTGKLAGKTAYITGASRGIGREIALKLAKDKANIVIASKTATPHPKLPGTIYTVAEEVEALGGKALPFSVDVRDEGQVTDSVSAAVKTFGGIDIVVNNASAIQLTGTLETEMKRYDLLHSINGRGTFLVTRTCLPYLKESQGNPQILNISPPLSLFPVWYKSHVAYTMSKFNMSFTALGWAGEFKEFGIKVNCLWPSTPVYTAAVDELGGKEWKERCRKPEIMGDAAYVVLTRGNEKENTGNFYIDEYVLKEEGVKDFTAYQYSPDADIHHYGRYKESVHSSQYIIGKKE